MGRHSLFKHLDDDDFLRCAEHPRRGVERRRRQHPRRPDADAHVLGQLRGAPHARHPAGEDAAVLLKAKPQSLLVEGANPGTSTSGRCGRRQQLPDDKVLVPGVIDTSTNFVEHPELVAAAHRRAMPMSSDGAGDRRHRLRLRDVRRLRAVHPDIAWAKLRSLTRGAELSAIRLAKDAAALV